MSGGSYFSYKARQILNKIICRGYQPGKYSHKNYLTNFETSEDEDLPRDSIENVQVYPGVSGSGPQRLQDCM